MVNMRGGTHITVVAYNQADSLARMFESLDDEDMDIRWHIHVHGNNPDVLDVVGLVAHRSNYVHVTQHETNRGLARSWNDGLFMAQSLGADYNMLVHDDAYVTKGDLDILREAADGADDRVYMISGTGWDNHYKERRDQLQSLCVITPSALRHIGAFDVNFHPIYYEDMDYYRRAELLGMHRLCVPANIYHEGSASLYNGGVDDKTKHSKRFNLNRSYYIRKWGGTPGDEVFECPFNDARFDCMIRFDERNTPYDEWDRQDLEHV